MRGEDVVVLLLVISVAVIMYRRSRTPSSRAKRRPDDPVNVDNSSGGVAYNEGANHWGVGVHRDNSGAPHHGSEAPTDGAGGADSGGGGDGGGGGSGD
ncbi:MAG: hypothetical protein ACKVP4_11095 [Hyphomicrobium sp.]